MLFYRLLFTLSTRSQELESYPAPDPQTQTEERSAIHTLMNDNTTVEVVSEILITGHDFIQLILK